jgi:hypothetical protein
MGNESSKQAPTMDPSTTQDHRPLLRGTIASLIVLFAALVTYQVIRGNFRGGGVGDRSASFALDLTDQMRIDPQRVGYWQCASIDVPMQQLRGIACDDQSRIYVAGDQAIHIYDAEGKSQGQIALDSPPLCLAVADDDANGSARLFVGMADGVQVLGADHQILAAWQVPAENTLLASIAVVGDEVFVADAGNRRVWRFNGKGELLGQIGNPDASLQIPGFVIPSRYFDIVAGSEGLLYCVNPGRLQVSTFTFAGDLGNSWGHAGSSIADFFGCCNPSHIARFSDGRFVTSERGIPRIKVYSANGDLDSVVAGPQQLGISESSVADPRHGIDEPVFDIAVDQQDRVLALDRQTRSVRIFCPKAE